MRLGFVQKIQKILEIKLKKMKRKEFLKTTLGAIGLFGLGSTILTACKKDETIVASNSSTTDPNPVEVTSCATATGFQKIICLVNALKAQLDATQLAKLQLNYSKSDAVRWSNFPQQLFNLKRVGLNFGAMNEVQISYAKALIKELSSNNFSNEGWDEIQQILNADNYLKTVNPNGGYGSENYYLAFLGIPSATGTFAIMFGGHHLAFQNTYKDGVIAGVTPSFRGIEPTGTFNYAGISNQPLEQENNAFLAVLNSLSSSELATSKLSPAVTDLVAGPQKDSNIPTTYSGIKCSNLSTTQKTLVLTAIKTYVLDVAEYASFLATYEKELENTYISYSGNTSLTVRGDYFRIHGPSVWIEWAVQPPVALPQPHIHSVWRDRTKDYGGN